MGVSLGPSSTILADSNAKIIAKRLETISGGKVLDIATGTGKFIRTLSKVLKDYTKFIGVDCCPVELEKARKITKKIPVEYQLCYAEKLPFKKESFDTVTLANSLHHMKDAKIVLNEMIRVLNYGGNFIIQEPFSDDNQTEAQKNEILIHTLGADIDVLFGEIHNKIFTKSRILEMISKLDVREFDMYITTRDVACLNCDDKIKCDNPKNKEIIEYALNDLEEILERVKNQVDIEEYYKRSNEIKERINEFGCATASSLYFIGKK